MRLLISVLLVVVLSLATVSTVAAKGDADCSGVLDSRDALVVLQYTAGLGKTACLIDADMNRDGKIDSLDAAIILQLVAARDY